MKFKIYLIIYGLFLSITLFSQKGKDGARTVTAANTKYNEFTTLSTNAAVGNATINVAASGLNTNSRFSGSLSPGDLIMIIQMQGALIKLIPTPVWAPDSTYGNIYSYGTCGNYEFAEVKSVISATQIELNCGLTYPYSASGKTQIIRVPRLSSLNVTSTGTLTTDAWNGSSGGVLAVEVDGNTTVNSGGSISANALGFRGGVAVANAGTGNGNFVTKNPNDGAEKGEGIGSDRLINSAATNDTLGKQCKGAPANGGGGGNANNCGGGGGGNAGNLSIYYGLGVPNTTYSTAFNLEYAGRASIISSGGGKGGYGTSTVNGNPNTNSPNNPFWGSFERPKYGGYGGRPLDYSTGKIYMGGGGGAGHKSANQSNGTNASSGGAGGGIIYLLNYGTISGTGTITANGANGVNSFGNATISNPTQGIDGAGGAGAGGTIILKSNGTISGITANASGGTGGNQVISGASTNEGQGPGGGGSGGYIAGNGSSFTQNVNGGTNGVTNALAFTTAFPMNGATSGNTGLSGQLIPTYTFSVAATSQTICSNQSATLSATNTDPGATTQWYNAATGGNAVATGSMYVTPVYPVAGTYTVYAGSCPGIYRVPVTITVNAGLLISVNNPTVCPGQSVVLTPTSSATSYSWSTTQTTNTISVSPATTTVYTVTGTNGSCNGTQTATVTIGSGIGISVSSATICNGTSTVISASGATTYTWNTGAHTNTLSVNPGSTTIYTVNGSIGSCTGTATSTVSVNAIPTLTLNSNPVSICPGQTATLTATGANTYTWTTGFSTSTISVSPAVSTSYSVTGTSTAGCVSAATGINLTVNSGPTVTVNSPTICAGQSATLSATGSATSYSWSTTQTTSTISVSPATTTVYTVTGTTAGCSSSQTATVNIGAAFSISVNDATICPGQSVVLTPTSSATSYTWNTTQTTNTISVSPAVTTVYAVTGSSGICSGIGTATVTVGAVPNVSATSATICAGQSATLTASGATSYTWNTGETTSVINPSPSVTTNYTVSGANSSGCSNSFVTTVNVSPSANLMVSATNASGCIPSSNCISFTNTSVATNTTITYTFGDGTTSNSTNPTHCYTSVGSYTVSATMTDLSSGCSSSYVFPSPITISDKPVALFSIQEGTLVPIGTDVHITNNSTNAITYNWNICGISANTKDISVPLSDTGTCCIILTASNAGCSDQTSQCIKINDETSISIPNVFTPNNDTKNDLFKINTKGVKTLNCIIFDRWGLKMFEWEGVNGSWDGKTKTGAPAPDGSYYYIVTYTDFKDTSKTEKGFLSLFRN